MVTERYLFLEKLYPDMLENDAYFVDMALNDYPILYRSALDPESDQLIRHAYQKSRSILSFYNKMRFAFFSRSFSSTSATSTSGSRRMAAPWVWKPPA